MPLTLENIKEIKEILASARGTGYTANQITKKLDSNLNSSEVEWFCNMSAAISKKETGEGEARWILETSREGESKDNDK